MIPNPADLTKSLSTLFKNAKKALLSKKYSEGLSYLTNAEEISSSTPLPTHLQSEILFQLANYFQALGQRQMSLKYLKQITKQTKDPIDLAKAHLNIGFILSLQGLHQKSIYHNSKALTLLNDTEEYEGVVSAYHSLGLGYQSINQYPKSVNAFKQGLIISKNRLGISHKLTKILRNLYLESSKNVILLGCSNALVNKLEQIGICQMVSEIESSGLKVFTPLPKYLSSKASSPVPKSKNALTRSVQCGTDENLVLGRNSHWVSVQSKEHKRALSDNKNQNCFVKSKFLLNNS